MTTELDLGLRGDGATEVTAQCIDGRHPRSRSGSARLLAWCGSPEAVTMPVRSSFEIPPSVLFREVDGQMVLLNIESEQYYGLNQVGADILTRLTSEPYLVALANLTRDYDVDPEILRSDIDALVGALLGAGLLHRVDPAP